MDTLHALLAARPQALAVVNAVLRVWPEHAAYLRRNFTLRSEAMLDATKAAAAACRNLIKGQEDIFAADHRWTCDRLRDEEIFFHREGPYRLSTFAEANALVYSRRDYMGRRSVIMHRPSYLRCRRYPSRCTFAAQRGALVAGRIIVGYRAA